MLAPLLSAGLKHSFLSGFDDTGGNAIFAPLICYVNKPWIVSKSKIWNDNISSHGSASFNFQHKSKQIVWHTSIPGQSESRAQNSEHTQPWLHGVKVQKWTGHIHTTSLWCWTRAKSVYNSQQFLDVWVFAHRSGYHWHRGTKLTSTLITGPSMPLGLKYLHAHLVSRLLAIHRRNSKEEVSWPRKREGPRA